MVLFMPLQMNGILKVWTLLFKIYLFILNKTKCIRKKLWQPQLAITPFRMNSQTHVSDEHTHIHTYNQGSIINKCYTIEKGEVCSGCSISHNDDAVMMMFLSVQSAFTPQLLVFRWYQKDCQVTSTIRNSGLMESSRNLTVEKGN